MFRKSNFHLQATTGAENTLGPEPTCLDAQLGCTERCRSLPGELSLYQISKVAHAVLQLKAITLLGNREQGLALKVKG
jgi:hypothetical protein